MVTFNDLIEQLQDLDVTDKAQALIYMKTFEAVNEQFKCDNYGFIGANFKPLSVTKPWIYDKQSQARTLLKLNWWQRPFDESNRRAHQGLTHQKWLDKRILEQIK